MKVTYFSICVSNALKGSPVAVAAAHCPLQVCCLPTLTVDRFPSRDFEQVDGLKEGEIWSGAAVINNLLHPWYILHLYHFLAVLLLVLCPIMRTGRMEGGVTNGIHEVSRHICIADCVSVLHNVGPPVNKWKMMTRYFVWWREWLSTFLKACASIRFSGGGDALKGQAGISMRCGDRLLAAFHLIGSAGLLTVWRQRGSGRAHGIKNGDSQWGGDALWLHKHIMTGSLIPAVKTGNCKENVWQSNTFWSFSPVPTLPGLSRTKFAERTQPRQQWGLLCTWFIFY